MAGLDNYIADMAKYASTSDSVRIRGCYDSVAAQLAKENRKFQYKVVQRGGSATLFGASIEWLNLGGVVLKCRRISQAVEPISLYADLAAFRLYMGDVGLLAMKSGISHVVVENKGVLILRTKDSLNGCALGAPVHGLLGCLGYSR